MGANGDDKDRFERYAQMLFGCGLWAYMLYTDISSDLVLADMTAQELTVKGVLYGFAAILIKGITTAEIAELIRAWRSK
ncbi:hypothetical protein [uncultured Paraglaciecola sp.]|uniref:hypothetical protein n=1 Tax=uncultured Paraglaciecola sp. TaxID=1765024 RepID=UPI0026074925|nr:hypothetical protein [uncultured Paraglaciecola sp.]